VYSVIVIEAGEKWNLRSALGEMGAVFGFSVLNSFPEKAEGVFPVCCYASTVFKDATLHEVEDLSMFGILPVVAVSPLPSAGLAKSLSSIDGLRYVNSEELSLGLLYRELCKQFEVIESRKLQLWLGLSMQKAYRRKDWLAMHTLAKKLVGLGQDLGLYWAAKSLFHLQKYKEAMVDCEKLLEAKSGFLAASALAAELHLKLGRGKKAIEMAKPVLMQSTENLNHVCLVGNLYFEMGDITESSKYYKFVLAENAEHEGAQQSVAMIKTLQGDTSALEDLVKNGKVSEAIMVCNNKALWLAKQKKYKEAETLFVRFTEVFAGDPGVYRVWQNLGACQKLAGKYEAAKASFERCATLAPADYTKAREQLDDLKKIMATKKKVS
jgi:tetratricopeptide (TPR) repeat protein